MFKVGEYVLVYIPEEYQHSSDWIGIHGKTGEILAINKRTISVLVPDFPSPVRDSYVHHLGREWFRKLTKLQKVLK